MLENLQQTNYSVCSKDIRLYKRNGNLKDTKSNEEEEILNKITSNMTTVKLNILLNFQ
jgi:hypothetical protein